MQRVQYVKGYVRDFWEWLSLSVKVVLILFLIVILGWATSKLTGFFRTTDDQLNTVMVYDGRITWKHRSAPNIDYILATGPSVGFMFLNTGAFKTPAANGSYLWTFEARFLVLAFAFGVPIAISLARIRKDRLRDWRRQHGKCPACGYDLRARHDRCPECGAVTQQPTATDST
jgi:hypothetical protein